VYVNMLWRDILWWQMQRKPSADQAALILLYALEERGQRRGTKITRARVSRLSLKRLWQREDFGEAWLEEVNNWLLSAGWTLFYAGTTFAVIKKSVVENWPRVAAKHIQDVLDQVADGSFDFGSFEPLLAPLPPGKSARSAGRAHRKRSK
jgi:hypothetical protein